MFYSFKLLTDYAYYWVLKEFMQYISISNVLLNLTQILPDPFCNTSLKNISPQEENRKEKKKISFHGSSHAGTIRRDIFLVIVSIISRLFFSVWCRKIIKASVCAFRSSICVLIVLRVYFNSSAFIFIFFSFSFIFISILLLLLLNCHCVLISIHYRD